MQSFPNDDTAIRQAPLPTKKSNSLYSSQQSTISRDPVFDKAKTPSPEYNGVNGYLEKTTIRPTKLYIVFLPITRQPFVVFSISVLADCLFLGQFYSGDAARSNLNVLGVGRRSQSSSYKDSNDEVRTQVSHPLRY